MTLPDPVGGREQRPPLFLLGTRVAGLPACALLKPAALLPTLSWCHGVGVWEHQKCSRRDSGHGCVYSLMMCFKLSNLENSFSCLSPQHGKLKELQLLEAAESRKVSVVEAGTQDRVWALP